MKYTYNHYLLKFVIEYNKQIYIYITDYKRPYKRSYVQQSEGLASLGNYPYK